MNGFAGVGKSTIAKRYIDEHPLALDIEGDRIIVMLGQWQKFEDDARKHIFELTKAMASTHLKFGNDVILTYLLTNAEHAAAFETLAHEHGADFFEILLTAEKADAIGRLMERGLWGEEGTEPLTEKDLPTIEALYDAMIIETAKRPNTKSVPVLKGDIDHTYQAVLEAIH